MAHRPSYASIAHRESFSHERLRLAENSIRLFQVQEGSKHEPISLRMSQFSSHGRPPYRGISYTWGTAANMCGILVNGRAFKIHQNLWNLLYHLRLRKETAFLWADALCIDQANLRERNFHVQLMGKIYDQAKSVIVWLGLPSLERVEARAMGFVAELVAYRKSHGDSLLTATYMADAFGHKWDNLLLMCQHHYWTRTWIIQEFLRASEVEVVCGVECLDWSKFEDILLTIQKSPFNRNPTILRILSSRPARLTLRRRARTASTLHELLDEYHDSLCTEKRDKVYGILGLASDCIEDEGSDQPTGMVPDYNKHIVEVYLDAVACIQKSLESPALLPSVVNLVRQTLLLSSDDIADYIHTRKPAHHELTTLTLTPDYVGIVDEVLPSWTSIRDLKLQTAAINWGEYTGWEIKTTRAGFGRRSSARAVHSALPDDMLTNLINVAETEPELACLHNYPQLPQLKVPVDHIGLHQEDKRLYDNPDLNKPCVVVEHNRTTGTLRLGFVCTNSRRGDLILQYQGLDTALICRNVGHDYVLVGKAIMVKHSQLQHDYGLSSVCTESPWLSPCLCSHNLEGLELQTDPLSLAELLTRT